MYIFKYLSLEKKTTTLASHNYDAHDDDSDGDDNDDDDDSLGIFVAVLILLKFLSFLIVLPEYCFNTPPTPHSHPTPPTRPALSFGYLMFGPNVYLSDLYPHPPSPFPPCVCLDLRVHECVTGPGSLQSPMEKRKKKAPLFLVLALLNKLFANFLIYKALIPPVTTVSIYSYVCEPVCVRVCAFVCACSPSVSSIQ